MKQGTRLLLEAGPLAVFFVANATFGIFIGTAALMAATAAALTANWHLERRVPLMPLVGSAFVLIFGGLTLFFEDDLFIKIKPTVVNALFAAALFVGLAAGRPLIKLVLGPVLKLRDEAWRTLSWRWALFFVFLAVVNEVVWRNFPTDVWVNFKVFGIMPLTLLFSLLQMPLILRHQLPEDAEPQGESPV